MATNQVAARGIEWLSRTLAVVCVMVGPGLLGRVVDDKLGTQFLAPTGLVLGFIVGTYVLLLLAKKMAPPAGGRPIPFADEEQPGEDQD